MTSDNDRLCPARNEARDVRTDDRLTENNAAEDVTDGAVGRLPHFLKRKFLYALLIRGDRGAFNTDIVLFDGVGRVNRDLIIRCVTALDR